MALKKWMDNQKMDRAWNYKLYYQWRGYYSTEINLRKFDMGKMHLTVNHDQERILTLLKVDGELEDATETASRIAKGKKFSYVDFHILLSLKPELQYKIHFFQTVASGYGGLIRNASNYLVHCF